MVKTLIILFFVLVVCTIGKEINVTKSEEHGDIDEKKQHGDNEDDESDSIQVIHSPVKDKDMFTKNGDPHEEHNNKSYEDSTISNEDLKQTFFEDVVTDSDGISLATDHSTKLEDFFIPTFEENRDYNNHHEKLEIVIEHITEPFNNHKNNHEDSSSSNDNDNIWRSAENDNSNEERNYDASIDNEDYSGEGFLDKKFGIDLKGRMEPRRREHPVRPMPMRHYGPPDDRAIIDTPPIRSYGDLMAPRYRPMLTRNGIVYTPTLYSMQTPSPILDHLHNHWVNRPHINQGEILPRQQNRLRDLPSYDGDPKMIDDYNDYGSNTYSYTPMVKVTTQAPPQQIVSPNKFNVFQKLVEASKKLQKRPYNDNVFPVNYYPQQYSDGYGPYDVRRFRRDAWDGLPMQDS